MFRYSNVNIHIRASLDIRKRPYCYFFLHSIYRFILVSSPSPNLRECPSR